MHDTAASTEFDGFIDQAWERHADDSAGVAQQLLARGTTGVQQPAQLGALARLGQHLWGAHLGQWAAGRAWLAMLRGHALLDDAARAELRRLDACLQLCAGDDDGAPALAELAALPPDDRIRVLALAAGDLAERDAERAQRLFQQALADAQGTPREPADPLHRSLAVSANNLAAALEEKPGRSAPETALMLQAAQAARHYWGLAGGWLEHERAEYRLALSWLQAGDAAQALHHARQCLAIVDAQPEGPTDPPLALERLFGHEAQARAAGALGDAPLLAHSRSQAAAAFAALPAADQAWCRATLDALRQLPG